jgi:arsenate reductase (thioredoxin)
VNVLFVCHDNCALSLMAESILRAVGAARFEAYSAGAVRDGSIDPDVLDFLAQHRLPVNGLWSKKLDHFLLPGAPHIDLVITLCETAASQQFSDWPDRPFVAHWSLEASKNADDAVRDSFWTLMRRIRTFTTLPRGKLNRRVLERRALTLQASHH